MSVSVRIAVLLGVALSAASVARRPQIGDWGFGMDGMDRSVRPGDSFFSYANGAWVRSAKIPADKPILDQFSLLEDLSARRTRAILEDAVHVRDSKIGVFYASFLDRAAVNAKGLGTLAPMLGRIEAATSRDDLVAVMGQLTRIGVVGPIDGFVDGDDKDPDRAVYELEQGGLGLSDREDYISVDKEIAPRRSAYRDYLARLLKLAGEGDAERRAAAVFDFEAELAVAHSPLVEIQDVDRIYNPRSTDQLASSAPSFPWKVLFQTWGVAPHSRLIVRQPDSVTRSAALIGTRPIPLIKDYLALRTLDTFAPYLGESFGDASFDFHQKALEGTAEKEPLWKRASDTVAAAMGDEIARIYVRRHFPPRAKAEADLLVQNVLAAWDRHIQGLTWMTSQTKARARKKLAALVPEIGYPIRWRDYSTLVIRRDDLVGNVMRANAFEYQRQLGTLGRPVDKREWYTELPAMGVNGYANHKTNQVVFSAGLLQPPFFDPNADPAVNYGAIGSVIAHEIGHEFDQQGARYDERGRLTDWWTPADVKRFGNLTAKLVAQYDQYEPLPGKHVSGKLTLAENIADLAGVTIAYDAYRASLGGKVAPVTAGFTGDQRFFLGWAQTWRCAYRRPILLQRLMTDIHSPVEQRVSVVRNVDGWYKAFTVRSSDKLYLKPGDRVRIW